MDESSLISDRDFGFLADVFKASTSIFDKIITSVGSRFKKFCLLNHNWKKYLFDYMVPSEEYTSRLPGTIHAKRPRPNWAFSWDDSWTFSSFDYDYDDFVASRLQRLRISCSAQKATPELTSKIFHYISCQPHLRYLKLQHMTITSENLTKLPSSLKKIRFKDCTLVGDDFAQILCQRCPDLEILDLGVKGGHNCWIDPITTLSNLKYLLLPKGIDDLKPLEKNAALLMLASASARAKTLTLCEPIHMFKHQEQGPQIEDMKPKDQVTYVIKTILELKKFAPTQIGINLFFHSIHESEMPTGCLLTHLIRRGACEEAIRIVLSDPKIDLVGHLRCQSENMIKDLGSIPSCIAVSRPEIVSLLLQKGCPIRRFDFRYALESVGDISHQFIEDSDSCITDYLVLPAILGAPLESAIKGMGGDRKSALEWLFRIDRERKESLLHVASADGIGGHVGLAYALKNLERLMIDLNHRDIYGCTALFAALNCPKCVSLLLQAGVDPNIPNIWKETPLMSLFNGQDELNNIAASAAALLRFKKTQHPPEDWTGRLDVLKRIIREPAFEQKEETFYVIDLLTRNIRKDFLIDPPPKKTFNRQTGEDMIVSREPLLIYFCSEDVEARCIKLLIERGADPATIKSRDGRSAMDVFIQSRETQHYGDFDPIYTHLEDSIKWVQSAVELLRGGADMTPIQLADFLKKTIGKVRFPKKIRKDDEGLLKKLDAALKVFANAVGSSMTDEGVQLIQSPAYRASFRNDVAMIEQIGVFFAAIPSRKKSKPARVWVPKSSSSSATSSSSSSSPLNTEVSKSIDGVYDDCAMCLECCKLFESPCGCVAFCKRCVFVWVTCPYNKH